MKLEIYKTSAKEYSWRLFAKGNIIARMPDGTGSPWKIKRTVKALMKHSTSKLGQNTPVSEACRIALEAFELEHPTRRKAM